jgi:hypothetical protein
MAMVLTPLSIRQVRHGTKVSRGGPSFIVPSEQQTISNPQTGHWDELRNGDINSSG